MVDLIILAVILMVLTGASLKIYKEKKKGVKCVGCPYAQMENGKGCSCDSQK